MSAPTLTTAHTDLPTTGTDGTPRTTPTNPATTADPHPLHPTADFYGLFADLPEADREAWARARALADDALPAVNDAWEHADYRLDLVRRMGDLDLLTDGVPTPGSAPLSPLAAGLINMEVARIDGSLATVIAVQGGLTMRTLQLLGSAEQQAAWLVPLARAEKLGAFGLTEPLHGSDAVGLETSAVRDGDDWVLNGQKRWIGNGSVGDMTIIWARNEEGKVNGFIVSQDTPGYVAEAITGKVSLRGIPQALITLTDVRVPEAARLPGARSFRDVSRVLMATRAGIAWAALGHAIACYEAAVAHAEIRVQFGKPLASYQLIQDRLATMLGSLVTMQLHCRRIAELDAAGRLRPEQASMAKVQCTRLARTVAADARDLLGGSGILLENHVIRHLADLEALHTYEGTDSVQSLIVGRSITGIGAFA